MLRRDWQHEIPLEAGLLRRVAHGGQVVAQGQVGGDHLDHGEGDSLSGTSANAHAGWVNGRRVRGESGAAGDAMGECTIYVCMCVRER